MTFMASASVVQWVCDWCTKRAQKPVEPGTPHPPEGWLNVTVYPEGITPSPEDICDDCAGILTRTRLSRHDVYRNHDDELVDYARSAWEGEK